MRVCRVHPKTTRVSSDKTVVADRARKLRAQYALQAQGLRTRLEMRINRIPRHLRKMNMGDLLQKHQQAQNKTQQRLPSPAKTKSLKRKRFVLEPFHLDSFTDLFPARKLTWLTRRTLSPHLPPLRTPRSAANPALDPLAFLPLPTWRVLRDLSLSTLQYSRRNLPTHAHSLDLL